VNSGLFKNSIVYILIAVAVIALFISIYSSPQNEDEIDLTQVAEDIKEGKVKKITIKNDDISIEYKQTNTQTNQSLIKRSRKEPNISILRTLNKFGVTQDDLSQTTQQNFTATLESDLYAISGRVADPSGHPVAGVLISANKEYQTTTNHYGDYTLSGLPPNSYTLTATKNNYSFSPASYQIHVPAIAIAQNFTAAAAPNTYFIAGRVTDKQGAPLANVTISAGEEYKSISDDEGHYLLNGLPPGAYTVSVSKKNYSFSPAVRTVNLQPNATAQNFIGMTTLPTYSVSGQVVDGSGTPVPDVLISAGSGYQTITDDKGSYTLTGLPDDSYTLKPSKGNYTFSPKNYAIKIPSTIEVEVVPPSAWSDWGTQALTILPLLIFGGLLFFMVRQAQGSNNQAISFGKSRARMFSGDKPTVTFDDVAGADEAKQELSEVVEFLREPEKFISLGARIPKGVLMVGPPGCGKTLLAKAVAGEAGVPFFSISGSEFVEMFVGVGASRVRDLFDQAKRNSPCIIFVDEIDAVGRHRGAGLGGSHDEREQTLNQILVEMDGFDTDTNVIVVAATNRPDILDPALLRPGRFDRRVILDRPDWQGRKQILEVHAKGKPLASDVDSELLAKSTIGFSGADLENVINEGAILAARRNQKKITMLDMQEAVDKIRMGPERRSLIISEEEKISTAYHEAGHALVAHLIPEAIPVYRVTIIPRGSALGLTDFLPEDDQSLKSESEFKALLAVSLGGRAAEEIVFTDINTGASSDLKKVTRIARAMVTRFGMSRKLGPVTFGDREELIFLGRQISEQRNYSEEVAEIIDLEVRRLVDEAHQRALHILKNNRDKLEAVARRLIEAETIEAGEFAALIGEPKHRPAKQAPPHSTAPAGEAALDDGLPPHMVPPSPAPMPA
jgi:cell division protease FtsH